MAVLKKYIKSFFYQVNLGGWMKQKHFLWMKIKHFQRNKNFKKKHPFLSIPNDKWLFETYQLNYQQYFNDGKLAAKEILEWTEPYLQQTLPAILDWGCGTGRIVQHMHSVSPYILLYGADTNQSMIEWNQKNLKGIHFSFIPNKPPTGYPDNYFDLVYGISVFTHLSESDQIAWLIELQRITKLGGILLVTTHGNFFKRQLSSTEKIQLDKNELIEHSNSGRKKVNQSGDRNFSSYQSSQNFNNKIAPYFNTLHFYDGLEYPQKVGGQDLWILQKK